MTGTQSRGCGLLWEMRRSRKLLVGGWAFEVGGAAKSTRQVPSTAPAIHDLYLGHIIGSRSGPPDQGNHAFTKDFVSRVWESLSPAVCNDKAAKKWRMANELFRLDWCCMRCCSRTTWRPFLQCYTDHIV